MNLKVKMEATELKVKDVMLVDLTDIQTCGPQNLKRRIDSKQTDRRTNRQKDRWKIGQMGRQTDGKTDRWEDRELERQTDGCINGHADRQRDR